MTIKLYHQVGHIEKWNIDAINDDSAGDGLILSPVHQGKSTIERMDNSLKKTSFFDPQFYLPSSQKKKLQQYDFFPDVISSGFNTMDFGSRTAACAKLCIDFQLENDFDRIVIPARHFDQMDPQYTEKQESFAMLPFLKELAERSISKPIFATLPLTSHMVANEIYRTNILNWITQHPELSGVYLIVEHQRKKKQIDDDSFLRSYLSFCKELSDADLDLVIGYQNSESLLFTLVGDNTLTMGSFENTRMFSLDKFVESDEDRRGPRARIYLPGLLNWIQIRRAKDIRDTYPEIWKKIYHPTTYGDAALNNPKEPTFNQSDLYRHYFSVFSSQIEELSNLSIQDRCKKLRVWIKGAMGIYSELEEDFFDFETHGNGDHLQPWLDTIGYYYRSYIKGP